MIASICGAVLNIVLNAVLIPLFGYQAAAYSMLIAFVFLSYVQMRVSKNCTSLSREPRKPYMMTKSLSVYNGW